MKISILNAGQQTDYLYGLVSGLVEIPELEIEVVDSNAAVGVIDTFPRVSLFNLRGDNTSPQSLFTKIWRISRYYIRLLLYALNTSSKIFHIQWDNSIVLFDRTFLILYYKLLGKKIIFTAHNIYREERDGTASPLHWLSLKIMYSLVDRIIVHTSKMKDELCRSFHIVPDKVIIIVHGINNRICPKGITQAEARQKLGIVREAHVVLFFGQIDTYKGIETLIDAASLYSKEDPSVVLLVVGKPKRGSGYAQNLEILAKQKIPEQNVRFRLRFIPAEEVENYFAAADCLVLPYKKIFQSGVIFLAYRFGIPIIATDVGSFREDIIDGVTGFICAPGNPEEMKASMKKFFSSSLFHQRDQSRTSIRDAAEKKYAWKDIGRQTYEVYKNVIRQT